ncbi:MAG: hypothetical protein WCP45_13725 [Verrucomicrobiota bacterium]
MQKLPEIIGISRRTLFSGRNSDSGVTTKTWLKLETAERAAGIGTAAEAVDVSAGKVKQDTEVGQHFHPPTMEQRMDRMEVALARIIELLEHPEERLKKSS